MSNGKAGEHIRLRRVVRDPKAMWNLVKDSVSAWSDDYAPSMGAALSYYTLFSIAPLLIIVIAIAGLLLGRDAAADQIFAQVQGLLGDEGAAAIQGMVKSASSPARSTVATIVGFLTLIAGATTVFGELQTSLDRIWKAPAAEKKEGIWNMIRSRVLSFGMILAIGFLLLISLVVSATLSALGSWWAPLFGSFEALLHVVNFIVSFAIVTVLFALIYKFLPRVKIAWRDVWVGAIATALLFTIGKFLIGLYIGKSSVASGFGAAGSLVVVLVWVYYSAQIFLLGAEFTWVYAYRYGSRIGEKQSQTARAAPVPAANAAPHNVPSRKPDAAARPEVQPTRSVVPARSDRKRAARELGQALAVAGVVAMGRRLLSIRRASG